MIDIVQIKKGIIVIISVAALKVIKNLCGRVAFFFVLCQERGSLQHMEIL